MLRLYAALKGWRSSAAACRLPPADDAKFYANGFRLKPKVIYCCQWAPSKMLLHIHYAQMYVPLSLSIVCLHLCMPCVCVCVALGVH